MADELMPGDEVELVAGFDHLYNPSPLEGKFKGVYVGCRATIRDRREDSVGFPHVYVEWNKEDWRYQGMLDGWTFENHFRKTKPLVTETQDNGDLIIKDMIETAKDRHRSEQEACPDCGQIHFDGRNSEFIDAWTEGDENIAASEGFIVISVHRDRSFEDSDYLVYDGRIMDAALTEEAIEAVEQQIINLAAKILVARIKQKPR